MTNIILFATDDHGAWAMGCAGNRDIRTPNLDRLAHEGAYMENAFSPTPVCSPARANMLTGRTASQHGVHDYLAGGAFHEKDWLASQETLADLLAAQGYRTGLVGKWHLGRDTEPQHGFQDWFALAGDYPIDTLGPARWSRNGQIEWHEGPKADIITDAAVDFITQADGQPFFLFVGHVSTHSEWSGHPEALVDTYRGCTFTDVPQDAEWPFGVQNLESRDLIDRSNPREALAQYYAAVTSIDSGVGRVLEALEAQGIREDTLVVYTSDHGLNCGHHGIWGKGNGTLPLNMVEETIRVPLILSQPGAIPSGQRRSEFVDHLDLFQTLRRHGCAKAPALELAGQDFMPMLRRAEMDWRSLQFCEYGDLRMVRSPGWKLLEFPDLRVELFDLENDPGETRDLSRDASNAAIIAGLKGALDAYYARYSTPEHAARRPGGPEPTNQSAPWVNQPA